MADHRELDNGLFEGISGFDVDIQHFWPNSDLKYGASDETQRRKVGASPTGMHPLF
jgi:hypothetical protein